MYDAKKKKQQQKNLDLVSNNHDPVPRRLTGTQTSPSLLLFALYITFMQHLYNHHNHTQKYILEDAGSNKTIEKP